jgi:crotonobetainyl-CoA:carnitine CoA-transferase CaiB-like acyl-CoA transferase
LTDQEWYRLAEIMEFEEPLSECFSSRSFRLGHQKELDDLVAQWTCKRTAEEVEETLQRVGIAASLVECGADLDRDPQLKWDGFYHTLERSDGGAFTYSGWPVKMTETPYHIQPAPALGEHNETILIGQLGFSDLEFLNFMESGLLD